MVRENLSSDKVIKWLTKLICFVLSVAGTYLFFGVLIYYFTEWKTQFYWPSNAGVGLLMASIVVVTLYKSSQRLAFQQHHNYLEHRGFIHIACIFGLKCPVQANELLNRARDLERWDIATGYAKGILRREDEDKYKSLFELLPVARGACLVGENFDELKFNLIAMHPQDRSADGLSLNMVERHEGLKDRFVMSAVDPTLGQELAEYDLGREERLLAAAALMGVSYSTDPKDSEHEDSIADLYAAAEELCSQESLESFSNKMIEAFALRHESAK